MSTTAEAAANESRALDHRRTILSACPSHRPNGRPAIQSAANSSAAEPPAPEPSAAELTTTEPTTPELPAPELSASALARRTIRSSRHPGISPPESSALSAESDGPLPGASRNTGPSRASRAKNCNAIAEAALAARMELGPEYDESVAANLAERVEDLAEAHAAELLQQAQEANRAQAAEQSGRARQIRAGHRVHVMGIPITASLPRKSTRVSSG